MDVAFLEPDLLAVVFFELDDLEVDLLVAGVLEPVFLELAFDRFGRGLRPPAFAAFVLTFSETFPETFSACSTAIASILSATVPTRSCAASVESTFLPASTAVSFSPVCFAIDPSSLS